jgi:hypothetical protein
MGSGGGWDLRLFLGVLLDGTFRSLPRLRSLLELPRRFFPAFALSESLLLLRASRSCPGWHFFLYC